MINEIRTNVRAIDNAKASGPASARSPRKHGVAGALLGATWFGAAFPPVLTGIGAVIGGRGR